MPVRGPRLKILRRLGTSLPGLTRKEPKHSAGAARPARAGSRAPRKPSALRVRLDEKQKVRFNYGITEQQLRRYLTAARQLPGVTGENLLLLLERRLDSVVFRLGFAPTIRAARQLVSHGHVRVGDRRVDRPAYLVEPGDTVSLAPAARAKALLRAIAEQGPVLRLPGHLRREPSETCTGYVVSHPLRADVPFAVRESLIIEYYAR